MTYIVCAIQSTYVSIYFNRLSTNKALFNPTYASIVLTQALLFTYKTTTHILLCYIVLHVDQKIQKLTNNDDFALSPTQKKFSTWKFCSLAEKWKWPTITSFIVIRQGKTIVARALVETVCIVTDLLAIMTHFSAFVYI